MKVVRVLSLTRRNSNNWPRSIPTFISSLSVSMFVVLFVYLCKLTFFLWKINRKSWHIKNQSHMRVCRWGFSFGHKIHLLYMLNNLEHKRFILWDFFWFTLYKYTFLNIKGNFYLNLAHLVCDRHYFFIFIPLLVNCLYVSFRQMWWMMRV